MQFPIETVLAAYPPSRKVGKVTLGPLTVGGWFSLGALGIDPKKTVRPSQTALAAWVLSGHVVPGASSPGASRAFTSFARGLKRLSNDLYEAVNMILDQAFKTYVPPLVENPVVQGTPSGLGRPLEIAEFLCAEYGWSWDSALATPVSRAFALIAAARQRNGCKHGGPDYIERIIIDSGKEEAV